MSQEHAESREYFRAEKLSRWYRSACGQQLLEVLITAVVERLKKNSVDTALQLGLPLFGDILALAKITQTCLPSVYFDSDSLLLTNGVYLPFCSDSFECVVLLHDLDISTQPHQLLREAERVLCDGGYLIVVGYNPMSIAGLCKWFLQWRDRDLRTCRFYSPARLKDWLHLLNFDVKDCRTYAYLPPMISERFYRLMRVNPWLNTQDGHFLGNIYVMVAKKQNTPVTPIIYKWRHPAAGNAIHLKPSAYTGHKEVRHT